ncbi:MAG: hypothetical protein IPG92_14010 [Flavobacteriales bacterium]|nr:hypothetical protein [Flavobacteriales bacterium]
MHRRSLCSAALLSGGSRCKHNSGAVQTRIHEGGFLARLHWALPCLVDVVHYDVSVSTEPEERSITGSTTIAFDAVADGQRVQIDFQQPPS